MKEELAKIEEREDQLDQQKFEEHDGVSFQVDDPEDLHPQREEIVPADIDPPINTLKVAEVVAD